MNQFTSISPSEINENLFHKIQKEWALLTAAKPDGTVNTMTISWGEFGHLWNRFTMSVVVRPQRFTKEFIDASNTFSVSFLPPRYQKELSYLGTVSGREEKKIEKSGLHILKNGEIPFFEESTLTFFCKVLYKQDLSESSFLDMNVMAEAYPKRDFHTLYIGQIMDIFTKK